MPPKRPSNPCQMTAKRRGPCSKISRAWHKSFSKQPWMRMLRKLKLPKYVEPVIPLAIWAFAAIAATCPWSPPARNCKGSLIALEFSAAPVIALDPRMPASLIGQGCVSRSDVISLTAFDLLLQWLGAARPCLLTMRGTSLSS